jgi:hypothetical protein
MLWHLAWGAQSGGYILFIGELWLSHLFCQFIFWMEHNEIVIVVKVRCITANTPLLNHCVYVTFILQAVDSLSLLH